MQWLMTFTDGRGRCGGNGPLDENHIQPPSQFDLPIVVAVPAGCEPGSFASGLTSCSRRMQGSMRPMDHLLQFAARTLRLKQVRTRRPPSVCTPPRPAPPKVGRHNATTAPCSRPCSVQRATAADL